jgi:ribosomal protein S18 acetylase RimI-like enzyme
LFPACGKTFAMTPLTDRLAIRALLETDRPWSVYPLGDLAPERFGDCTWLAGPGPDPALVLLYRAFAPPVLFTLGKPAAVGGLLDELAAEPELYLHVRPEVLPLVRAGFQVRGDKTMWRLVLDPARYRPAPAPAAVRLGPADLPALRRLFADGEPAGEAPGFFAPSMLTSGVYFGVREGAELVAAAGTHLVEPQENVAAVGNVYTRRDRRGRGLATLLTGAVAAEVQARGLRTIALNVEEHNPALRVYERLGFVRYCTFIEGLAVRDPQPSGVGL